MKKFRQKSVVVETEQSEKYKFQFYYNIQSFLWWIGIAWHNSYSDECTKDFNCCNSNLGRKAWIYKSKKINMKKVITILVFAFLAIGCQEKEDVKPDIEQEQSRGITIRTTK